MMALLRDSGLRLAPAQLRLVEEQVITSPGRRADGVLEVTCRGREQRYVIECKNRSTPQTIQAAMAQARRYAAEFGLRPLVFVPYLSNDALSSLEKEEVSGVDLSGNGVILAPDFTIWRSGEPNRYPEAMTVRNLYRGASTLFVRCLLLRPEFESLTELREYALSRLDQDGARSDGGARLTKGTASKVMQQLEEEMLVRRDGRTLRVADAERLMEGLRTNYRPPDGVRLAGQTTLPPEEIWRRLSERRTSSTDSPRTWRYAATGLGSATRYRVLSGPDKLSLYVSDLDRAADLVELRATRVFPNVELIEDRGDASYFDGRRDGAQVWASPVQTWLELATGGPRERDAAETLASALAQSRGEQLT